jgi:hypothetical protein
MYGATTNKCPLEVGATNEKQVEAIGWNKPKDWATKINAFYSQKD